MYKKIEQLLSKVDLAAISESRQAELQELIDYIQSKKDNGETINLNFICTHNSRRSQFSQIWAKVMSDHYNIETNCFSGGIEVTAFNKRAVRSLEQSGFIIHTEGSENPQYKVYWNDDKCLTMFSKLFDASMNPEKDFAAVMTCSHADENCPFVYGSDARIPIRYDDPKAYDDTPLEKKMYDERSLEIASEMMFVFSKIK